MKSRNYNTSIKSIDIYNKLWKLAKTGFWFGIWMLIVFSLAFCLKNGYNGIVDLMKGIV